MEDETELNRDTTEAREGVEQQEGQFDGGKAKKEGEQEAKKSLEPEALASLTKGKKPGGGKTTRTLPRESERSRQSFAGMAAAAKAGRKLQVQLLKSKAEKSNKVEEESKSKSRENKPYVAINADIGQGSMAHNRKQEEKGKEPPDKEEPADAVADLGVGRVDLGSHLKTEHSTLIGLIRRRKERREKDCINERKGIEEEDAKRRDKEEEEMKSPVILGSKKGKVSKAEEPHLLHVGTPFEVLNFNSRVISHLFSLSPGLRPLWTSGGY